MNRTDIIDEECPTNDFESGVANGTCWGDGHFMCTECIHYREDFKRLGQDYIDYVHNFGTWKISTLK